MDTIKKIEDEVTALKALKENLTHQIDQLQKESYEVKDDAFGLGNRVKTLMATTMKLSHGMNGVLGEIAHHLVDKKFESARGYLDYISQTISSIREYISNVDQVIANLEKCKNDLHYQIQATEPWLNKSKELQK